MGDDNTEGVRRRYTQTGVRRLIQKSRNPEKAIGTRGREEISKNPGSWEKTIGKE